VSRAAVDGAGIRFEDAHNSLWQKPRGPVAV